MGTGKNNKPEITSYNLDNLIWGHVTYLHDARISILQGRVIEGEVEGGDPSGASLVTYTAVYITEGDLSGVSLVTYTAVYITEEGGPSGANLVTYSSVH